MWVPTLQGVLQDDVLPTGLIFSSFMVCITIGGVLFSIMLRKVKGCSFFFSFPFFLLSSCVFTRAMSCVSGWCFVSLCRHALVVPSSFFVRLVVVHS